MSASTAAPVRSTPSSARTARGSRPSSGSQVGSSTPIGARSRSGANPFAGTPRRRRRKLRLGHGLPGHLADPGRAREEQPLPARRRRGSAAVTGGGRSGRGELLAEFDLDLELFPDAPAGVPHAGRAAAVRGGQGARDRARRCCCSTSPRRRSAPTRSRRSTARSPRASGAASAWSTSAIACPRCSRSPTGSRCCATGGHQGTFDAATTTEPELVELIVGRPFEAAFPPPRPEVGRAARGARRRWPAGPVVRPGQLHAGERRGRRDRRRRGQRPAPALRLPGGPAAAEGGPGRLRRQGADR